MPKRSLKAKILKEPEMYLATFVFSTRASLNTGADWVKAVKARISMMKQLKATEC